LFELPIPDEKTRAEIFRIHAKNKPLSKDVDLDKLAKETEGRVGSDIEFICRKASMFAVREFVNQKNQCPDKEIDFKVSRQHFEEAVKMLKEQNGN
jgi:transitional endoplasmic reticulum ATPase